MNINLISKLSIFIHGVAHISLNNGETQLRAVFSQWKPDKGHYKVEYGDNRFDTKKMVETRSDYL